MAIVRNLAHLLVHLLLLAEQIDGRDRLLGSWRSVAASPVFAELRATLGRGQVRLLRFHLRLELGLLDLGIEQPRRCRQQALILVTHDVSNARRQARLQLRVLDHLKLLVAQVLLEERAVTAIDVQRKTPVDVRRNQVWSAAELAALPGRVSGVLDRSPLLRREDIGREVVALARILQSHEGRLAHLLVHLTLEALHGQPVAPFRVALRHVCVRARLRLHLL